MHLTVITDPTATLDLSGLPGSVSATRRGAELILSGHDLPLSDLMYALELIQGQQPHATVSPAGPDYEQQARELLANPELKVSDDLDGMVNDDFDNLASGVNNGGTLDQLTHLLRSGHRAEQLMERR